MFIYIGFQLHGEEATSCHYAGRGWGGEAQSTVRAQAHTSEETKVSFGDLVMPEQPGSEIHAALMIFLVGSSAFSQSAVFSISQF